MAGVVGPISVMDDGSFALNIVADTYTVTKTLAADTAEYINVPTGAKVAVFGASTSFMARYNAVQAGTGAAAFGDATPDQPHEMNPTTRRLAGITEISVIARAACELSVTFYKG
jgi:hypothetical protein